MSKLILTRGLPGSGKSTWAREYISKHKAINICKDDLRDMAPKLNEGQICEIRDNLTMSYIHKIDVIWSDTNLNPVHEKRAREIVPQGTAVEIKDFTDVPLETCIKQDLMRLDSVGKDVIMETYYNWLCPKESKDFDITLPSCYIVDVDGTLAEVTNRSHYDYSPGAVLTDSPRMNVIRTVQSLSRDKGIEIIFVSGREDICREDTAKWLETHAGLHWLLMRKAGDTRNDTIIKREIYEEHIKGRYNVLGCIDDRPRVLREWRKLGLTTFDVGKGYEF